MNFINLAAQVCNQFETSKHDDSNCLLEYKDGLGRDIVTKLDLSLHKISENFMLKNLPNCRLYSEEGLKQNFSEGFINIGEWLVVDPLDGSLNFFNGIPFFGYMASHLVDGFFTKSLVVLPYLGQYIVYEDKEIISSQVISLAKTHTPKTVYYAYAPRQTELERITRNRLFKFIDTEADGFYRYGSACAGLYNVVCKKHNIFIGHGIRIWDALSYFPILQNLGYTVQYSLSKTSLDMVAGSDEVLIEHILSIFGSSQGTQFTKFHPDNALRIS
jgi:myo-inositol-1(or 4)-monophosphatase